MLREEDFDGLRYYLGNATRSAGTATTALPRLGQQYAPRRPTAAKGILKDMLYP